MSYLSNVLPCTVSIGTDAFPSAEQANVAAYAAPPVGLLAEIVVGALNAPPLFRQ